ncbi:transcription factor MAMYB [Macadamia integrifolia]|uniref:transcription factor MAMYB n=1 Tax=Macadamia integrifolia TaxID=60698 RepID=UPI001C4EA9CB|nr:transcription factor MAMYB [Macadamia integrifolia]
MEFFDEESRPRFLFQSRVASSQNPESETQKINKPLAFICISVSILLFVLSFFFLQSETLKFLFIWFSLSLLVGPFAPISITGGDIRVGNGEPLEPLPDLDPALELDESKKRGSSRRQKVRRSEDSVVSSSSAVVATVSSSEKKLEKNSGNPVSNGNGIVVEEEKEWTDEDFELLTKQILKHPVGEPKRWEKIAEGFRGRHGLESVIKTAKSLSEKRPSGGDSFSQFLKQRKPLDKRLESVNEESSVGSTATVEIKKENNALNWTSGEDIALLNALKAFPKDVPMRWEKIAAAVPGKTKASCMKRVTELKRDFRSSKAIAES